MESSSGESFLWTDVSNDSSKSGNMSVESNGAHKSDTDATGPKQKVSDPCLENQNDLRKKHKAGKKRKGSISSNDFQSEKKRIKLEPESDLDIRKKKKHKKKKNFEEQNGSNDSTADDEFYLNKKVKEEQASLLEKKYKNSLSNSKEMESFLNLKVKEEQVSEIESEPVKSKKKKKHRHSSLISDSDSVIKAEAMHLNKTFDNECTPFTDDTDVKNHIIEEKFSAEETVVEKPKKKKNKKNTLQNSTSCNNSGMIDVISKQYLNEEQNEIDISLQPDFTCNNIVSSTIINMSTIETKDKQQKHKIDGIDEEISHGQENHRTVKISDRIQFEDDESSSREINLNKQTAKIQHYLKINSHLQAVSNKHNNCTLTEDDEIWILRFPHEMDYQNLLNTKLTLEGKHKIKIDGQTYDGVSNKNLNKITLLANQHEHNNISGSNFYVKGFVSYHKRIPKVHIPDNISMVNNQTNFIPLPETKNRHPLFGANFKKAIKIPIAVAERLEAAKTRQSDDSFKTSTRKHKKEKKKSIEIKIEENCSTEPEPSKKKKKRKHSQDDEAPPRKRKHTKHGPDSTEVWESEKAIEESLFNF